MSNFSGPPAEPGASPVANLQIPRGPLRALIHPTELMQERALMDSLADGEINGLSLMAHKPRAAPG